MFPLLCYAPVICNHAFSIPGPIEGQWEKSTRQWLFNCPRSVAEVSGQRSLSKNRVIAVTFKVREQSAGIWTLSLSSQVRSSPCEGRTGREVLAGGSSLIWVYTVCPKLSVQKLRIITKLEIVQIKQKYICAKTQQNVLLGVSDQARNKPACAATEAS